MNYLDQAKLFCLNNTSIESDVQRLQRDLEIDLGASHHKKNKDQTYYRLFPEQVRKSAYKMSQHYEIFYCLEIFIREFIEDRLREENPQDWWTEKIPEEICKNTQKRKKQEESEGVTLRSDKMLSYTTFGELSQIIEKNWNIFNDSFSDNLSALKKIMRTLNSLRAPIAHCGFLAEDEIIRLDLTMRDLFRLMP